MRPPLSGLESGENDFRPAERRANVPKTEPPPVGGGPPHVLRLGLRDRTQAFLVELALCDLLRAFDQQFGDETPEVLPRQDHPAIPNS